MPQMIHSLDTCVPSPHWCAANHLQHSFRPSLFGTTASEPPGRLIIAPAVFLMNGSCAIALFLLLSDFELSERILAFSKIASLLDAILKRWPRLAGSVLTVNLLSGTLMGRGLYMNTIVADQNGAGG